jgi:hypothetical protein
VSRCGSRRTVAALTLAALLCALALTSAACGAQDDPFTGLWWEPSTGRRIEINKDGDAYRLYYGAAKRPYPATRDGDELRIREPMGGSIVVKMMSGDGLDLVIDGESSHLERVPQHQ